MKYRKKVIELFFGMTFLFLVSIELSAEVKLLKCEVKDNDYWEVVLDTSDFSKSKAFAEYSYFYDGEVIDAQVVELRITPRTIRFTRNLPLMSSPATMIQSINRLTLEGITLPGGGQFYSMLNSIESGTFSTHSEIKMRQQKIYTIMFNAFRKSPQKCTLSSNPLDLKI